MISPCTLSWAVLDPNAPSTLQMTGPDCLRVTLWMANSTQLMSPSEQNWAENCFEDEVTFKVLAETDRTRSPSTCQVMTSHAPCTVALNRTSEPRSTVEFSGCSWNSCGTTEERKV